MAHDLCLKFFAFIVELLPELVLVLVQKVANLVLQAFGRLEVAPITASVQLFAQLRPGASQIN